MAETDTSLLDQLDAELDEGTDDPSTLAHIVQRHGDLGAGALIRAAAEARTEVTGLCGRRWIPNGFATDDLPICRPCLKAFDEMQTHG